MNDRNDMDCREVYGLDEYDAYLDEVDSFEDWSEAMDGDHDSAMASAGWGTDEDYGAWEPCDDF
jgi:hypothetical protein